jgi:hypothetical protein
VKKAEAEAKERRKKKKKKMPLNHSGTVVPPYRAG